MQRLEDAGGSLSVGDKSDPRDIKRAVPGISKREFKSAVGALYRLGTVQPGPFHVDLVPEDERDAKRREFEAGRAVAAAAAAAAAAAESGVEGPGAAMDGDAPAGATDTVFLGNMPYEITEAKLGTFTFTFRAAHIPCDQPPPPCRLPVPPGPNPPPPPPHAHPSFLAEFCEEHVPKNRVRRVVLRADRGFAHVQLKSVPDAVKLHEGMSGTKMKKRDLKVDFAAESMRRAPR